MTFFLRNKNNQTIASVVLYEKDGCVDLSTYIDIGNYSDFLLSHKNENELFNIITDFSNFSELRGWLWEYFEIIGNKDDYDLVKKELSKKLEQICKKYSLSIVED